MKKVDKVFVELVNKMLKKHGVNYDFVLANPLINGEDWFYHYTWTQKEQNEFIDWAVNLLIKKKKWSKAYCEKEMGWFMLAFGLRVLNN
jgi:hypothetical protein